MVPHMGELSSPTAGIPPGVGDQGDAPMILESSIHEVMHHRNYDDGMLYTTAYALLPSIEVLHLIYDKMMRAPINEGPMISCGPYGS